MSQSKHPIKRLFRTWLVFTIVYSLVFIFGLIYGDVFQGFENLIAVVYLIFSVFPFAMYLGLEFLKNPKVNPAASFPLVRTLTPIYFLLVIFLFLLNGPLAELLNLPKAPTLLAELMPLILIQGILFWVYWKRWKYFESGYSEILKLESDHKKENQLDYLEKQELFLADKVKDLKARNLFADMLTGFNLRKELKETELELQTIRQKIEAIETS